MMERDDHRVLANIQELWHQHEDAPGMVYWQPRGLALYEQLVNVAKRRLHLEGYQEVRSPQLMRRPVWEKSGHWEHFKGGMFYVNDEHLEAALKPVSCPAHAQLFQRSNPSYRELPMRLAEFGLVHRDEPSGSLQGLLRLRQFTQDDGHIFCREEHIVDEISKFCEGVIQVYKAFGFDEVVVALSTRPVARYGDDARWDRAEAYLYQGARQAKLDPIEQPGEGAFYGPKLEFKLVDWRGRQWQMGTIQLDFVMPERFELSFNNERSQPERPVMLHRAIYGSVERFMGIVLEHHQGSLPAWLAPEQIVIVPVHEDQRPYAQEILSELNALGLRAKLDVQRESLGKRLAHYHRLGIPYQLVIGRREAQQRRVNIRHKGQREVALYEGLALLKSACAAPI